jgi:phosphatidylglycerophosphate synthase
VPTVLIVGVWWFGLPGTSPGVALITREVSHGIGKPELVTVSRKVWTAANVVTGLGLLGMLDAVHLIGTGGNVQMVPIIYVWAWLISDGLDGATAKRHNCHSVVGAIIDPVRDRCGLVGIVLSLVLYAEPGYWLMPAIGVGIVEFMIGLQGRQAQCMDTVLNTHGMGKVRQGMHILAGVTVLTVLFLIHSSPEVESLIIAVSFCVMLFGSGLALMQYKAQVVLMHTER